MAGVLNNGQIISDLWIDAPDARQILDRKLSAGLVTPEEADAIASFIENGYVIIDIGNVDAVADNIWSSIDILWQNPPTDLVAAGHVNGGRPLPMDRLANQLQRGPGVRILDCHSHVPGAYSLYLNTALHRMCNLLFGHRCVATQSLLFEYGSTQDLHRDPWYVNHTPRSHLLAAWIALEDIHPDSGPLTYVPKSHRLPYFEFSTGDIVFHDPRVKALERTQALAHMKQACAEAGLAPQAFCPRKGQALIWHASLVHGGSPVNNPALTRRSLVVHYGREDTHGRRGAGITVNDKAHTFFTTKKYSSAAGTIGYFNPLAGLEQTSWGV